MTNTAAIEFAENKAGTSKPYIAFLADSMENDDEGKKDATQKLYRIGDFLVTGTTDNADIYEAIVAELEQEQVSNPARSAEELSRRVIEISDQMGLNDDYLLNITLGGKQGHGLGLFHINATGWQPTNGNNTKPKKTYVRKQMVFDGSGSKFTQDYLRWTDIAGVDTIVEDLPDAFEALNTFGKAAATDRSVNDRLQYGIVSLERTSLILPRTMYPNDAIGYINHSFGAEVPDKGIAQQDKPEYARALEALANTLGEFHHVFDRDLDTVRQLHAQFRVDSEELLRGTITEESLRTTMGKYREAKELVRLGAEALALGGFDRIENYVFDAHGKMKAEQEAARNYVTRS